MMLRAPQAQAAATLLLRHSPSRSSSTTTMHQRTFASIPHHLARQNNGMVNVFVKSTKVPRPSSRIVKTFNRSKPLPTPSSAEVAVPSSLNGDDLNHETAITASVATAADIKEEEHLSYAGNINIPITSQLKIVMPGVDDTPRGIWPVFRMMVCLHCYLILCCLHVVCVVIVIDMKGCFNRVTHTPSSTLSFIYQPLSSTLFKG